MYARPLPDSHPDFSRIRKLADGLIRAAGDHATFIARIPPLFRTGIDEVIDAPRTGRMLITDTEKTEKTYLGTKMEILFRNELGLPKGERLDLLIDGEECDIKHTMGRAWSIPKENISFPAVLLREDEEKALCDVGVILVRQEYLNAGKNRDLKTTISAAHEAHIWWILQRHPYPKNFWLNLTSYQLAKIMKTGASTHRLAELFRMLPGVPVPRSAVEALAQQLDPLKRIRRNGGARDLLAPEGIAILFGKTDRKLLDSLGYTNLHRDEFISHIARDAHEVELLRRAGHID